MGYLSFRCGSPRFCRWMATNMIQRRVSIPHWDKADRESQAWQVVGGKDFCHAMVKMLMTFLDARWTVLLYFESEHGFSQEHPYIRIAKGQRNLMRFFKSLTPSWFIFLTVLIIRYVIMNGKSLSIWKFERIFIF